MLRVFGCTSYNHHEKNFYSNQKNDPGFIAPGVRRGDRSGTIHAHH